MLYKELLSVWPQLLVVLVVEGTLLFGDLAGRTGLGGLAALIVTDMDGLLVFMGCLAFALGHGQVGPEVSHRHVELLDALPVTRFQMYLAKLTAGLVVVGLLVLVTATGKVAVSQLMWGASGPETLTTLTAATAAALLSFYGTGLLLSWFGGFGWAILGVGFMVVGTLAELVDTLRPLSVFHGYGTVRFEANRPQIVLWPIVAWAAYGVGCALVSGVLFVARGDRLVDASTGVARTARSVLVIVVSGLLVLSGSITASRLAARGAGPLEAPVIVDAGTYRVSIPKGAEEEALALVARVPALDRAVRETLGATTALHLDVELGGGGRFHAGRYTGGKIRMSLQGDAQHTFAHELAHAYVDQLTEGRFRRHHNAVRFFNEGLAMWVADQVHEATEQTFSFRAWAGNIYQLGHYHLDLLMNDGARKIRYDPFEPYPLGLAFVEALVAKKGAEAIGCVLRQAAALPDQPMAEEAVWGRLLAGCGVESKALAEAYERHLDLYASVWGIGHRPPRGVPAWVDGRLVLEWPAAEVERDAEQSAGGTSTAPTTAWDAARRAPPPLRCRFRSRIAAPVADLSESEVDASRHRCPVTAVISATETVSYQIGVKLPNRWVVYGPWIEQPLPPPPHER